jgi:hypothetical protein
MSDAPDWTKNVALPTLRQGKRVLTVEGNDDKDVYTAWLKKLTQTGTIFSDKVVVVAAGDKQQVLQGLKWFHGLNPPPPGRLYGLVDRDEWDTNAIAKHRATTPELLVNPRRHCLESYFSDPLEIEAALRAKDAAQYSPFFQSLHAVLQNDLTEWIDHWSLWVTTCRVSRQMTEEAFPGFFHDQLPLPDDAAIEARLNAWAGIVSPSTVLGAFHDQRSDARLRSPSEQLRGCVHAKRFYRQVVVGEILQSIDRVDYKSWMLRLAKWMPEVPSDVAPMLLTLLQ